MNFLTLANLFAAYKSKSLLRSSELPAAIVAAAGFGLNAVGWVPKEAWDSTVGPAVGSLTAYTLARVYSKAAAPPA